MMVEYVNTILSGALEGMGNPQEREMDDFKKEVRQDLAAISDRVDESIESTTSNVDKIVNAMHEMTTVMAVSKEHKKHQDEKIEGIRSDHDALKKVVDEIKLERAEEKPSRDFIRKYWPVLFLVAVISMGVISAIGAGYGKSLFN